MRTRRQWKQTENIKVVQDWGDLIIYRIDTYLDLQEVEQVTTLVSIMEGIIILEIK